MAEHVIRLQGGALQEAEPLPEAILSSSLGAREKVTYLWLRKKSRYGRQLVLTSTATIAAELGANQRAAQRWLKNTVETGLLKVRDRGPRGALLLEVCDPDVLAQPRVVQADEQLRLFTDGEEAERAEEIPQAHQNAPGAAVSDVVATGHGRPAQDPATETGPNMSAASEQGALPGHESPTKDRASEPVPKLTSKLPAAAENRGSPTESGVVDIAPKASPTAVNVTEPIDLVLSRLDNVRRSGKGWSARCPAHDDRRPSLFVWEGQNGSTWVRCYAGCPPAAVVAALTGPTALNSMRRGTVRNVGGSAKRSRKVYPSRSDAIRAIARAVDGQPTGEYCYRAANGSAIFWVVRFDLPTSDEDGKPAKEFRPIHQTIDGWHVSDPLGPLPLYRGNELPDNLAELVLVCEGEKAVDAAQSAGLHGVTSAHGASAVNRTDWTSLAGRTVAILPDNDATGLKYADSVATILTDLDPAPTVKIVRLPNLPPKGDIVEFLAAGGTPDGVRKLVEASPEWTPPVTSNRPAIVPYQPFPMEVLPKSIGRFVRTAAEAIGCDASFVALPLLSGLAAAIGNSRQIMLKEGWTEPAVVWTALVGESGTYKSPALGAALQPIEKREQQAMQQHAQEFEEYQANLRAYEADLTDWKKRREKQSKPAPQKPKPPIHQRYLCADVTLEALAHRLADNPRGLLVARDELAAWLGSFDQYKGGRGGDVAGWLSLHIAGSLRVDRKTGDRPAICIPRAAVSITGGIQPETLRSALGREHFENGLAARLLLAMPPRPLRRWTDKELPRDLVTKLEAVFCRLWSLQAACDQEGEPYPVDMPLVPQAQEAFITFVNQHGEEQAGLAGDVAAAWCKLEAYAARLALVVHFIRWAEKDPTLATADAVDEKSILASVRLVEWFKHETRRVYAALSETDEVRERRRLVELVERRGGRITANDLRRRSRQFETSEDAERALDDLVKASFGRWEPVDHGCSGGRPTRQFVLSEHVSVSETPSDREESASLGYGDARENPGEASE